jgi:hypothetical protein
MARRSAHSYPECGRSHSTQAVRSSCVAIKSRPTLVHVIKGTLTSRPQDMPEVVLHAGDGYAGIEDSECLLENTDSEPAEFIWLPVYRYTP